MEIFKTNGYYQITMKFKFITLDKYGEETEWLHYFVEDILRWPSLCLQFAYIVIVNLLLV